jgi:hypothetical protein
LCAGGQLKAKSNHIMSNIPENMTAIEITEFGGPEGLKPTTIATPQPGYGEVLI